MFHSISGSFWGRAAGLAVGVTLAACSAPQVQGARSGGDALAASGDWDGAAARYQEELAETTDPDAREAVTRKRDEAVNRAISSHVDAGHQALAAHDLATAERHYQKAATLRADDPRVVAGMAAATDLRTRGAQTVSTARTKLAQLTDHAVTLADRAAWLALIKDLEWLSQWPRDFTEGGVLWREAREPVTAFLLLEAQELVAAGKSQQAEAIAQKALAWSPGHPQAVALMEQLRGENDVQQLVAQAESELQAGRLEQALAAYETLAKRPNPPAEVATGLKETRKRLAADLLLRAKDHRAMKNWAMAMRIASRARAMATDDAGLTAEAARVFTETHDKLVASLQGPMAAAVKKKLPAAALLYAQMILSMAPGDKAARKVKATFAGKVAAEASTRVEIVAGGVGAAVAKKPKRHKAKKGEVAEPVATVPTLPGLDTALVAGVRRGLAAAGLERAGIAVVTGKKAKAQTKLLLTVEDAKLERTESVEARTKNFLDHVEIVDNPAFAEAEAKRASALLALNVAIQDLRPVQEGINEADRELFAVQQQLAEVRQKIADEDAAYYKANPSPCPDGSLTCEGTRGKVRWRANVEYYEKQLQRQQALVAELGPKRVKLQAGVDEKQAAYDAAVKTAADTPKRVPKEVWLPHEYQVQRVTYVAKAALEAKLLAADGAKKAKKAKKGQPAESKPAPFTVKSQWQQSGEDFATGAITVKGQVLEANHPSNLPSDVTVVNQVVDKLLAPVVPAVVTAVGAHGQRFVRAAANQKDNLAKVQQLALAWLTAPGLPETDRKAVQDQLAALTAWLPPPGRLDAGTIAYDKLPALK